MGSSMGPTKGLIALPVVALLYYKILYQHVDKTLLPLWFIGLFDNKLNNALFIFIPLYYAQVSCFFYNRNVSFYMCKSSA